MPEKGKLNRQVAIARAREVFDEHGMQTQHIAVEPGHVGRIGLADTAAVVYSVGDAVSLHKVDASSEEPSEPVIELAAGLPLSIVGKGLRSFTYGETGGDLVVGIQPPEHLAA